MEKVAGSVGDASTSREAVIRALVNRYDPCCRDRKLRVVDVGLIESISIRERRARIEIVLIAGWWQFADSLLERVKQGISELPEVDNIEIEVNP